MPFPAGTIGAHDDGSHQGSAKRDAASGVAGIESAGNLLIPGSAIFITRDLSNNVDLRERTSGEYFLYANRVGVTDYDVFVRESGVDRQIQTAGMKDVASGIAGLDTNIRLPAAELPAVLRSGLIGTLAWAEMTVVAGTWTTWSTASQTDFDDLWISAAGVNYNSSAADLDEVKLSSLVLNAGTYDIKVVYVNTADSGILEVLHGATSIGTQDLYAGSVAYNQIATFTYSPTARTSADLRFRANGKNVLSGNYKLHISRIQIRKTA